MTQTQTPPLLSRLRPASWPVAVSTSSAVARRILDQHRLLVGAVVLGAVVRAVAIFGFRPAMWFNDGFEYLGVARRFEPYTIRPNGYSAFLRLLEPFHSFAFVVAIQHLMGLAVAVLLYALLRRWGLPGWLATLGVLPQLLDGNLVQLEHVVLSDTLFTLLLVGGLVVLLWNGQEPPFGEHHHDDARGGSGGGRAGVSVPAAGAAGLLLAGATLTRSIGLPLLALAGMWLVVRRVGWRPLAAFAGLALLPLLGYAAWFKAVHGQFALVTSDGVFLYSRIAIFAECEHIDPPERLRVLCESRPPDERGDVSSNYLWHPSPLNDLPGVQQEPLLPPERFSADRNGPAGEFARMAILAQPGDYLRVGWKDILRTFQWGREPFPNATAYSQFPFSGKTWAIPDRVFVPGGTAREDTTAYEHGAADTRLVQPYADWIIQYQRFAAVRGPFLALLMLTGTVGLVLAGVRRASFVWPLALVWATAVALVVIPPFTAQYDFRYALPAVPLSGLTAACAVALLLRLHGPPAPAPESAPAPEATEAEATDD